eukprot:Colp12_sorted_trinity150504_noHs@34642
MVCEKCEKKLAKVAAPDPFRNRDKATTSSASGSSTPQESRRLNENKLLSSKSKLKAAGRSTPYSVSSKCKICKTVCHLAGAVYCQGCAFKKGICAMCGRMITDTKDHKMSSV